MIEDQNGGADYRRHEEHICREIVDTVNSIILRWGADLKITFINTYAQAFFGYTADEILGKSLIGTVVPEESATGQDLKALIEDIFRRPDLYVNNENENVRHDGSRVWISWTNRAIMDDRGNVRAIISVGNDITRRKRAEDELRRQLRIIATMLDVIPLPVFYKDARGIYTGCNRAFADLVGRPKDEIVGRTVYDVAPAELAAVYREADERLLRHPGRQTYESAVVDARGKRHDVAFINSTFPNDDGTVGGMIGVILDITERNAAWREMERRVLERTRELERANEFLHREAAAHLQDEDALRESEERFRAVFDRSAVGIAIADTGGYLVESNPAYQEMLGYTGDELRKKRIYDITYPDDVDKSRGFERQMKEGAIDKYTLEKRYIGRDGRIIWIRLNVSAIRNPDGSLKYNLGVVDDITERVRAREALVESEERFRSTFEQAAVGIAHVSLDGHFIRVNRKYCDVVGYTCKELTRLRYQEITYPPDARIDDEVRAGLLEGGKPTCTVEKRYIRKDGSLVWVSMTVSLVRDGRGEPGYYIAVVQDITDRRQAEEAMRNARFRAELYLDLMGHDITNMNQAIMGYLDITREVADLKGHEELIEQPLEIIKHSSRLIASVKKLEMAQSGKYPTKVVVLDRVLKEVADAYAKVPGREVRINYLPAAGCYVLANELLKDVFDNLVDNAIRHSRGPVRIDIAVEPVLQGGRTYYRVSVADNGPGISDDLKQTIFRFVDAATGAPGRRGLGLYMVRTLVRSYGGKVWVEDRIPGDYRKGSRFMVLLRAAEPASNQ